MVPPLSLVRRYTPTNPDSKTTYCVLPLGFNLRLLEISAVSCGAARSPTMPALRLGNGVGDEAKCRKKVLWGVVRHLPVFAP